MLFEVICRKISAEEKCQVLFNHFSLPMTNQIWCRFTLIYHSLRASFFQTSRFRRAVFLNTLLDYCRLHFCKCFTYVIAAALARFRRLQKINRSFLRSIVSTKLTPVLRNYARIFSLRSFGMFKVDRDDLISNEMCCAIFNSFTYFQLLPPRTLNFCFNLLISEKFITIETQYLLERSRNVSYGYVFLL